VIRDWKGLRGRPVVHEVVPCCADLKRFKFSNEDRARRRAELNLNDRFTIVYSGSLDGWYLTEKMADFFASFLRHRPNAHFLWLTPSRHTRVKALMEERGIEPTSYSVRSVSSADVPSYLSASDAGLAFIRPCFSKLASSPTKHAEYLACGLPLIINAGIGDSDTLVTRDGLGALVGEFSEAEYAGALDTIEQLASTPEATRNRARAVAEQLFNLETVASMRYARLYERVLAAENC
jgi:glycosyltransferase involved in cell wall biosynthesis